STKAKASIREAIRKVMPRRWSVQTLQWFAEKLNPKIRGWINYYTKYYRYEALSVFCYLNERIMMWMRNKYKIYSKKKLLEKFLRLQAANPELFYHWEKGIKSGFR
ncbi:MAG TPA: group II intron maturase-specific domain-containing protein, partial [Segetibacter sp.]